MTDGQATPKPTKGHAVTLDRERHLRYSIRALKEIQEDQSLGNVLLVGLRHEDPDLTLEAVEDMVTLDMIDDIKGPLKAATGGLVDLGHLFQAADELVREAMATDAPAPEDPEKKGAPEKGQTSGS